MKGNDNNFVIRQLDGWFRESLVDLAACYARLQICRQTDPLMRATDVQIPRVWDEEMDMVLTEDANMIFYAAGCFMVFLGFDLACKYDASSGIITKYVTDKLKLIARDIGTTQVLGHIYSDTYDQLEQIEKIHALIAKQRIHVVGRQHIYGN